MKAFVKPQIPSPLKISGALIWISVALICMSWPFLRPSNDFDVFYIAWRTVLEGKGLHVYSLTPDRFLYAPGFAWFFAPLGIFTRSIALGLWSLAKFWVIVFCAREFAKQLTQSKEYFVLSGFGLLVVLRPLMIDFQYGQVNAFLFFFAAWALRRLFFPQKRESANANILVWFFFGVFSVGKLITLPLLVIPFLLKNHLQKEQKEQKRNQSCAAAGIAGAFTVFMLPVLQVGVQGWWHLHLDWLRALQSRGFPLESHNQSIAAILQHWFSGVPIRVIVLYQQLQLSTSRLLSENVLTVASYLSAFFWIASILYLAWFFLPKLARAPEKNPRAIALSIALLIALVMMPSHLVWKPYFISGLPLVWVLMSEKSTRIRIGLFASLALLQFSGVDFIGPAWAGWLEAGGVFMAAHLLLIALGVYRLRTLLHEATAFDARVLSR